MELPRPIPDLLNIWAVGFIQALKARGRRVPEEVAVIGYDDLDLATVIDPELTTVNQCHAAYAKAAMDLVRRLTDAVAPEDRIRTIVPQLVVRQSS